MRKMQSPPPPANDVEADSQSHQKTPFTCPYSVTLRRNPSRKARPTPLRAPVPFDSQSHHQAADAISEILTESVLSTEHLLEGGDESKLSEDLKVFLRIRPLKERFERRLSKEDGEVRLKRRGNNAWPKVRKERDVGAKEKDRVGKKSGVSCIAVNDSRSVTVTPPVGQQDSRRIKSEAYEGFSQVFAPESSQEQVYDKMLRPLVKDFLKGKSGLLVAMGPSGSGKTHTVFGCAREPGMVPLALRQIFQRNEEGHSIASRSFYLTIFEISSEPGKGEKILDLLSDGADISIYQSSIKGLQETAISDVIQAESIISYAMLKRSTAMTNTNSQSSRSQCIISIHMDTQRAEGNSSDLSNRSVLTIIDLAGAERSKRTGMQGKRLGESSFINNTSMVFGLCLRSLFEHQKNPKKPLQKHFQSSLLTRYLRDYLEGKKRMSLILTVKSEEEDYTDTSFVLRQASPYMQIKFAAQPDLLGAKRQLQTLVRSDQVKRVKFGNFTGPKADRKGSATETCHLVDEEATCTDDIKESLSQNFQVEALNLKENDDEAPCKYKMLRRSGQIMQNFAKVIWKVLKEYKRKLQDAKNEIHSLKEGLDFEKTRRLELEREIQYLKANCCCLKEISCDSDMVKVDTYLEFNVEKSRKSMDATYITEVVKTQTTDEIICHTSQFVVTPRENDSSEGQNLEEYFHSQTDCDTRLALADAVDDLRMNYSLKQSESLDHYSDGQVTTSPLSPELAEPKERDMDQQSDTIVQLKFTSPNRLESANKKNDSQTGTISVSAKTDGCSFEASLDKHDQKPEMSPELVESESTKSDQLSPASVPTSIIADEHCSLLGSSQEKLEQETEGFLDIMPNNKNNVQYSEVAKVAVSSPSSAKTRVDSPRSKADKPMLYSDENKEILSMNQLKQKDEQYSNDLMGNGEILKNDLKPSPPRLSNIKPKRRLMPASTVLLRDMRAFDLEDESDNRSKGNRGRKNPNTEENQRTQGSNILRLLKSNLHR